MSEKVRRVKRERSATESLLSIALMLEGFLIFFVALAAFALHSVTPVQALVGGIVFLVLILVAARTARGLFGQVLGSALQLAIVALGLLMPLMYVIGAGFLALWVYCFVKGRSLDAAKAAHFASTTTKENQS